MHHPTDRITHATAFVTPAVGHWLEQEIIIIIVIIIMCIYMLVPRLIINQTPYLNCRGLWQRRNVPVQTWRVISWYRGKSVRLWCDGSSDRSFMVNPLSNFSFRPVFHDWCNKGRGISGFPLSISERFCTICPTPFDRK